MYMTDVWNEVLHYNCIGGGYIIFEKGRVGVGGISRYTQQLKTILANGFVFFINTLA